MLTHLQIENYALLEQVGIEFGSGLNVLTGETGSGKSIVVDALGLLLGERADAGAIRSGAAQAAVTGCFTSPFTSAEAAAWCAENGISELEDEIRLRREVGAQGRSRAFVGHQVATLSLLRQLAERLGEIHSQHEALVSFTPAAQLALLDRFAGAARELEAVAAAHAVWKEWHDCLNESEAEQRLRLQQADLARFQAGEIDAAHPLAGEDQELERERTVLANAERIAAAAQAAYQALYDAPEAAVAQLKQAQRQVADWQRFDAAVAPLLPRLESLRLEADDIAGEIRSHADRVEASPERLAKVEERLGMLDRLRRKYGPTLDDVLRHRAELAAQLEQADTAGVRRQEAQVRLEQAATGYRAAAETLSRKRRAAAARLGRKLEAEASGLAMTVRFQVGFDEAPGEWTASGWDRVTFLASMNPGEPPMPVADIASGGELSRLLLALHVVAPREKRESRTLVLDEVDAGIGGRAAEAVGRKMRQLGQSYQVLCVTHLPQIASFAHHHFVVEKSETKGRTRAQVRALNPEERIREIARMLAGNAINATALRHAEEMLAAHAG